MRDGEISKDLKGCMTEKRLLAVGVGGAQPSRPLVGWRGGGGSGTTARLVYEEDLIYRLLSFNYLKTHLKLTIVIVNKNKSRFCGSGESV